VSGLRKTVAVIHTSFVSVNDLKDLFKEIIPDVQMINLADDSLLAEVIEHGGVTPNIVRRMCRYAMEAQELGADLILNQCSSVSEVVDIAQQMINIPYLKIDEPMAEEAVNTGKTISVIATLPSTLSPSCNLVERTALKLHKNITIRRCLVEGAFKVLLEKGKEKHNCMVLEKIREEAENSDVIVLAQGSMICLLPQLQDINVPVLTSPRAGVTRVRDMLGCLSCEGGIRR
jgi:Asp/Glu/hydantoin racemase